MPCEVLVVDDDLVFQEIAKIILSDGGYPVLLADGGREALTILRSTPTCGLTLLDVRMPQMNGIEVAKEMAKDQKLKDIPRVFVTAVARPFLEKLCRPLELVNEVIYKPLPDIYMLLECADRLTGNQRRGS